jgi:hypothetical protein
MIAFRILGRPVSPSTKSDTGDSLKNIDARSI